MSADQKDTPKGRKRARRKPGEEKRTSERIRKRSRTGASTPSVRSGQLVRTRKRGEIEETPSEEEEEKKRGRRHKTDQGRQEEVLPVKVEEEPEAPPQSLHERSQRYLLRLGQKDSSDLKRGDFPERGSDEEEEEEDLPSEGQAYPELELKTPLVEEKQLALPQPIEPIPQLAPPPEERLEQQLQDGRAREEKYRLALAEADARAEQLERRLTAMAREAREAIDGARAQGRLEAERQLVSAGPSPVVEEYEAQIRDRDRQLADTKNEILNYTEGLEILRTAKQELEKEMGTCSQDLKIARARVSQAQDNLRERERQVEDQQGRIQELVRELEQRETDRMALAREQAALRAARDECTENLERAREEVAAAEQRYREGAAQDRARHEKALRQTLDARDRALADLEAARDELRDVKQQLERQQGKVESLNNQLASERKDLEGLQGQHRDCMAQSLVVARQHQQCSRELDDALRRALPPSQVQAERQELGRLTTSLQQIYTYARPAYVSATCKAQKREDDCGRQGDLCEWSRKTCRAARGQLLSSLSPQERSDLRAKRRQQQERSRRRGCRGLDVDRCNQEAQCTWAETGEGRGYCRSSTRVSSPAAS